MPCDSVRTNTVELTAASDHDILEVALKALYPNLVNRYGQRFSVNLPDGIVRVEGGRLTGRQSESDLQDMTSQIKREYGKEVVNRTAKRYNFRVQWGVGTNAYKYQMFRR